MKEKFVITVGRQLGSGGRDIAHIIGERLGIKVYDRELINEAARKSGLNPELFEHADEKAPLHLPLVGALTADISATSILSSYINNDTLFGLQSQTIRELASRESCIVIGRCADYVLREQPNVLSTFITASESDRINRIMRHTGTTAQEATTSMRQTERKRAAYYNYYTFKTWGAAESYDITLNSSVAGVEKCAEIIIGLAESVLD
ncbi:MAG: cytidylate kinase-like family protein [Tidjanibacter sp.]|nr:cytidylate kinase-like family protein [Tidjanibacter sp.]